MALLRRTQRNKDHGSSTLLMHVDVTGEQVRKARLTVASYATDEDDLARLLELLGIGGGWRDHSDY